MIPVRISPETKPPVVTGSRREVSAGHWLDGAECPACGKDIKAGQMIVLVFVGRASEDAGRWTAGAVAVHAECAEA